MIARRESGKGPRIRTPRWLRRVLTSPYTTLFTALVLLVSGLFEAFETVLEDFFHIEIKTYHGLLLFAAVQIGVAIEHILKGFENLEKIDKSDDRDR